MSGEGNSTSPARLLALRDKAAGPGGGQNNPAASASAATPQRLSRCRNGVAGENILRPAGDPQTNCISKLCKIGYETKSSGVTRVIPGTIRTCSKPNKSSTGHKQSANWADKTSVPSEAFGASFFAAIASVKCPRNIAPHYDHGSSSCQYVSV